MKSRSGSEGHGIFQEMESALPENAPTFKAGSINAMRGSSVGFLGALVGADMSNTVDKRAHQKRDVGGRQKLLAHRPSSRTGEARSHSGSIPHAFFMAGFQRLRRFALSHDTTRTAHTRAHTQALLLTTTHQTGRDLPASSAKRAPLGCSQYRKYG